MNKANDLPAARALGKFSDPETTADGSPRARVALSALETLWFNTGTLCNIECANCYIHSSPRNDALVYLGLAEVEAYLDEIAALGLPTREIGFTGGEPFMNPDCVAMIGLALERGFGVLVLTNAMRPMMRAHVREPLAALVGRFGARLTIRVSLDHFEPGPHDAERGEGSFAETLAGLRWLRDTGARLAIAGRAQLADDERDMRAGFAALFRRERLPIDADDPAQCVLFPEMDERADVPEVTTDCWEILGKSPDQVMCATSRMVVRRRGAARSAVLSCTLLTEDAQFELGATLSEALGSVALNHRHCARFCVLGGASCSG